MWYVHKNGAWSRSSGPDEILSNLKAGKLAWTDFAIDVYPGSTPQRLFELFPNHLPPRPSLESVEQLSSPLAEPPSAESSAPRAQPAPQTPIQPRLPSQPALPPGKNIWFVQYSGSEFGPLRLDELTLIFKSGKLKGNVFGWRKGMPNWMPVSEIPELQDVLKASGYTSASATRTGSNQKRQFERTPLLATIKVSTSSTMSPYFIGVCMDISAGGSKILSDFVPGGAGTRVFMKVSPAGYSEVPEFEVEAEIVRATADPRGFAVRFLNMPADAEKAIKAVAAKNKKQA